MKINGISLSSALRHAHDVDEESQAFLRLWSQELEMAEMGHIHDRFYFHDAAPSFAARRYMIRRAMRPGLSGAKLRSNWVSPSLRTTSLIHSSASRSSW